MDLWTQFVGSPWARFTAITVVLPYVISFLKPFLPTGEATTPDGEAVENRWTPVATIIAGAILGILGGAYVVMDATFAGNQVQYLLESAIAGAGAGFAATGGVRAFKLAREGDRPARKVVAYKDALDATGIEPPKVP